MVGRFIASSTVAAVFPVFAAFFTQPIIATVQEARKPNCCSSGYGRAVAKVNPGRGVVSERTMGPKLTSTVTVRLLNQRLEELMGELRALAPEVVRKLEQIQAALKEQRPEPGEYEGLGRPEVIRKYLLKVGRPAELREIRDAVAAPVSRFDGRSIWDGGKREVEQGRLLNIADGNKGEDWVLSLPEWDRKP
jgi:hypothetical protein